MHFRKTSSVKSLRNGPFTFLRLTFHGEIVKIILLDNEPCHKIYDTIQTLAMVVKKHCQSAQTQRYNTVTIFSFSLPNCYTVFQPHSAESV